MTCANCVATIERNLRKLTGVVSAVLNLSSERATVEYDPHQLGLADLIAGVQRVGYGVATGKADLILLRLDSTADAARLENALTRLEGVRSASVSPSGKTAHVEYVPTILSQVELRRAVRTTGFEAVEFGGDVTDGEALAREREIEQQRHLLLVGLIFTLPLFLLAIGKDFSLLPEGFLVNLYSLPLHAHMSFQLSKKGCPNANPHNYCPAGLRTTRTMMSVYFSIVSGVISGSPISLFKTRR